MATKDIAGIRLKQDVYSKLRKVSTRHRLRSISDTVEVLLRGWNKLSAEERRAAIERGAVIESEVVNA